MSTLRELSVPKGIRQVWPWREGRKEEVELWGRNVEDSLSNFYFIRLKFPQTPGILPSSLDRQNWGTLMFLLQNLWIGLNEHEGDSSVCLYLLKKACPGLLENSVSFPRYPPHHPHLLPRNQSKISYLPSTNSLIFPHNFYCIKTISARVSAPTWLWRVASLTGSCTLIAQHRVWHMSVWSRCLVKWKMVSNLCKIVDPKAESRLCHLFAR